MDVVGLGSSEVDLGRVVLWLVKWKVGKRSGNYHKVGLAEKAEIDNKVGVSGNARVVELDLVARTAFDPEDEYRPEPVPEPLPPAWLEGGLRIGIHTSIAGSHVNALESAAKLGCSALQIFSVNPRMWAGGAIAARITEAEAKAFRDRREVLGLGPLVIHANYLINLAAPAPMLRTRSIQSFHEELVRGIALGADFIVVHPGSCTDSRPEQAVREGDRLGEAGGEAAAGDVDADIDREYGGDGERGWVAAGRSGRDCCGAERDWSWGVFGYGAFVCGGV